MTQTGTQSQAWQRGFLQNALGMALPIVASLLALPVLMHYFGVARFGAFALVLAVLAYISVLDLGLGAALTYRVAALVRESHTQREIALLVRTAMVMACAVGFAVGAITFAAANPIAKLILKGQPQLALEAASCLRILSLALPAIFVSSVASGLLAGHGDFGKLNLTRVPAGALNAGLPAAAAFWGGDLGAAAWLLLVVRIAAAGTQMIQCARLNPHLFGDRGGPVSGAALSMLVGFGGWLTVSNMVGPFMVYMDRFYLAQTTSPEQVGQYVAAYEVASKLLLLPALVLPVFFPMLVRGAAEGSGVDSETPVRLAAGMLLAASLPASVAAALAPNLIGWWLGDLVPSNIILTFQLLIAAAAVNCVAQVFFARVQALGRTALIAKVHVAELFAYAVALWWLTSRFGVLGAAIAWAARVMIDALIFCGLATPGLPAPAARRLWHLAAAALLLAVVVAGITQADHFGVRALALLVPLVFLARWWRDMRSLMQWPQDDSANLATP